jgi:hypothetical protein
MKMDSDVLLLSYLDIQAKTMNNIFYEEKKAEGPNNCTLCGG